ncbi:MAG TPA: hypothetical protein VF132_14000 [Rudaea sp.]
MRGRSAGGGHHERAHEQRRRVAVEAARLMTESGIRDFHMAKRKAAERLGVRDDTHLPKNSEIEEALREHQRLFEGDAHAQHLHELREVAREAMRFFARFEPRLVGAVLEGTADRHSAVCLHLFCDTPEEVIGFLSENAIPFEEQARRLRLDASTHAEFPAFVFRAESTPVDVTVLPRDNLRQAPLDRVDEKPMRRATLAMVEQLLAGPPSD